MMYRFFSPHIQMESLQNSEPFVPQKQKKIIDVLYLCKIVCL